jgi:hypothetical protein
MAQHPLIATWALISTEWRRADGRHANPFGQDAIGVLIYADSGYMSAQIMRDDRLAPDATQAAGIDAAMASGVPGYVAYFGAFAVDDAAGVVTHRVLGSAMPAWVGREFARRFMIQGDILTLRDDLTTSDGVAVDAATVWQRMS